MERNPKNNNSTDSFYIRSPKVLSVKKEFEVWDCVIQESHAFLEEHDLEDAIGICGIAVSSRY